MIHRLLLIAIQCQPLSAHKMLYNSNLGETHYVNSRKESGEINPLLELAFKLQTNAEGHILPTTVKQLRLMDTSQTV